MSKAKRCFIVNGQARRGRALKLWQALAPKLLQANDQVVVCQKGEDLRPLCRDALEAGAEKLIAVGGDGTASIVTDSFFVAGKNNWPQCHLGIVPLGTGCDYYRSLAGKRQPTDYLKEAQAKLVDLLAIEIDGGQYYGLNTISLGIGATITAEKEALPPQVPSLLSYALPTLKAIPHLTSMNLKPLVDGKELQWRCYGVMIAKGEFGGGGMRLGPKNCLDSGSFAISVIEAAPIHRILLELPKLYGSGLRSVDIVQCLEGKSLHLDFPEPQLIEMDGELYQSRTLKLRLLPKAISVLSL